jgi:hypothetical protein
VTKYLYVEGGGETASLKTECRQGFHEFLVKAGFDGRMPRIVACGSRKTAYDNFRQALSEGKKAVLLVDSEAPFEARTSWEHLNKRPGDQWTKPDNATDDSCILMVQCMEYWLIGDKDALKDFFGKEFREGDLPRGDVFSALQKASKDCKASHNKGRNSFKILAKIQPSKISQALPSAHRFIEVMNTFLR